jgi:hypothetical protein
MDWAEEIKDISVKKKVVVVLIVMIVDSSYDE